MIGKTLTKQLILLGFILLLGGLIFYHLNSFIPSFLGACTIFVISAPLFDKLVAKKIPSPLAALLIVLLTIVVFVVPVYFVIKLVSPKVEDLLLHSNEYFVGLNQLGIKIKEYVGFEVFTKDFIDEMKTQVGKLSGKVLNFTLNIFTTIFMTLLILFFLLINEQSFIKFMDENNPLSTQNIALVKKEIKNNIYSNALMIPLIAILQGILLYIGYAIFGIQDSLFWGVISIFACFIPFVGGMIIWVPLSLSLMANNEIGAAIGLTIYALLIVGSSDNLLRIFLQSKMSDAHPLITIFGVILGLNLFGFIGLIFGPIIISLFLLLIKVYNNEFFKTKIP